jgi:hypothetical protein
MKYLTFPNEATARRARAAIDTALGLPRRAARTRGPRRRAVTVARTFRSGAYGWTEHECALHVAPSGAAMLVLTGPAIALGARDVLVPDVGNVAIDTTRGKAAAPADFDAPPDR